MPPQPLMLRTTKPSGSCLGDVKVAVYNVAGEFHATSEVCTLALARLSDGCWRATSSSARRVKYWNGRDPVGWRHQIAVPGDGRLFRTVRGAGAED